MPSTFRSWRLLTTSSGWVRLRTDPAASNPCFRAVPERHTPALSVLSNAHLAWTPEVFRRPLLSEGIELPGDLLNAKSSVTAINALRVLFRLFSKTQWFHMVRMDAIDAYVLYFQIRASFPSWLRGFESRLPLHVFTKLRSFTPRGEIVNAVSAFR